MFTATVTAVKETQKPKKSEYNKPTINKSPMDPLFLHFFYR